MSGAVIEGIDIYQGDDLMIFEDGNLPDGIDDIKDIDINELEKRNSRPGFEPVEDSQQSRGPIILDSNAILNEGFQASHP